MEDKEEKKVEDKKETIVNNKKQTGKTSEEAGKKEELTNKKEAGKKKETNGKDSKDEKKKKEQLKIVKKEKAEAYGADLPISTKHSIAICDFIRYKNPEKAIADLEEVVKLKKAISMKGEIPHRKGMMSGRYPVNAAKVFIKLVKQLIGNSNVNGLENPYISLAKADRADRPHRRFGSMRFKRTNVLLEAREKIISAVEDERKAGQDAALGKQKIEKENQAENVKKTSAETNIKAGKREELIKSTGKESKEKK